MNAQELFTASGKSAGIYFCEKCRLVSKDKQFVDECCICKTCGEPYDRKEEFTSEHKQCFYERSRKRHQELLAEAELVENYEGPIYLEGFGRDGYIFDDWDETIADGVESPDDWPEFAFCCTKIHFPKADADDIVERCADGFYEDAYDDITVPKSLIAAVDEFNEVNKHLCAYDPDYKRKVRIPPMPDYLRKEMEIEGC